MLYVCSGMPKAGTTYTWNLTKLLLAEAGHPFIYLPGELRGAPGAKNRGANNISEWSAEVVANLAEANDPQTVIPLRTHVGPSDEIMDLLHRTGGKVHVAIRDPRDVALSLMDVASKRARAGKVNFSGVVPGDFRSTFMRLHDIITKIVPWAEAEDLQILYYEDTAFRPEVSIKLICEQLGIVVPEHTHEALVAEAAENPNAKRNVAQSLRHTREMPAEVQEEFLQEFRGFYERFFPDAVISVQRVAE